MENRRKTHRKRMKAGKAVAPREKWSSQAAVAGGKRSSNADQCVWYRRKGVDESEAVAPHGKWSCQAVVAGGFFTRYESWTSKT